MQGRLNRLMNFFFLGILLVTASSCTSSIPENMQRQASESPSFTAVLASPASYNSKTVLWGGQIERTVNYPDRTDIFLSETPLDERGHPQGQGYKEGMFIARTSEHIDPGTYAAGNDVTVAGTIIGQELGTLDEKPYVYPVVKIEEIHLWKPGVQWEWGRVPYYWPNQFKPQQYR